MEFISRVRQDFYIFTSAKHQWKYKKYYPTTTLPHCENNILDIVIVKITACEDITFI